MSDLTKLIYGEEFAAKLDKFQTALLEIEKKHIDFFKGRKSRFSYEEHDKLHNHYILQYGQGPTSFGFQKDSGIPEYIQKECFECFNSIF